MATWAIGDIQGCRRSLVALLEAIDFRPEVDRLWFAGDLVNRGPESLAVLRMISDLGDRAVAVLGNHDLNLLAVAAGLRRARARDTLEQILRAPDRDELIDWLRSRPVMHEEGDYVLVHAGLVPRWTIADALALARRAEARLRADDWRDFMAGIYPDGRPDPDPEDEVATALSLLTFVRCVDSRGAPIDYSGPPEHAPSGATPWYALRDDDRTLLFGHWAAAGYRRGPRWVALDSGCVWGERLTAFRLEDGHVVQVDAAEP